jgi:hypothetical protein
MCLSGGSDIWRQLIVHLLEKGTLPQDVMANMTAMLDSAEKLKAKIK